MATGDSDNAHDTGLTFYPAFCFKASPTHFAWVKMAAVDVHRLRTRKGFEGNYLPIYLPNIYLSWLFVVLGWNS